MEHYIVQIMRGERKAPLLKPVLRGLSFAYKAAIALRHFCYDRRLFPTHALKALVVSVGNLVVGGTGKTPLIHLLCIHLQKEVQLAVLTRGFKSQLEKRGEIQKISDGSGPRFSADECGDEPYLLAQKTRASIWVGADRVESGKRAVAEGAQCLLLDDGLQHRRLERDIEIVVVDGNAPFSSGNFLPYGLLRDTPERIRSADLVIASHPRDPDGLEKLQFELKRWTEAPIATVKVDVINRERFAPAKAAFFCGIGSPERFRRTIEELNQEIVASLIMKDHESANLSELECFAKECRKKGARYILCTEKDAVKLPPALLASLEIVPVEMELKITSGKEHWDNLINHILAKVNP